MLQYNADVKVMQYCDGSGEWVTIGKKPPLNKRAFQTSSTYDGNLGGVAGADQKCQDAADAVPLGGTWKAWLRTSVYDIRTASTQNDGPYVMVDGTVVANNWTDLVDGSIDAPMQITELSAVATGLNPWTGQTTGTNYCTDWTTNSSGVTGRVGSPTSTAAAWESNTTSNCNIARPLLCFEQ